MSRSARQPAPSPAPSSSGAIQTSPSLEANYGYLRAGPSVNLVSQGASWREWSLSGGRQTAEVFRMDEDPGELLNGNTLCGGEDAAGYIVFLEDEMMGGGRSLQLAVFGGDKPPFDINSDGLCGSFSYAIE